MDHSSLQRTGSSISVVAAWILIVLGLMLSPLSASADNSGRKPVLGDLARARLASSQQRAASVAAGEQRKLPSLERVEISRSADRLKLLSVPSFKTTFLNRVAAVTSRNEYVFFTLDPELQKVTEKLVKESRHPHVAVVVMNPVSGRILALADKSPSFEHLMLHADFPAASLFKVITAAAAVEQGKITPFSSVHFRGGTYTLNKWNYLPDRKLDRRQMTVAEALGRSCNPVFARIALNFLDRRVIDSYAEHFGFNQVIPFDLPLATSEAIIPGDNYGFSRTAAGFGHVRLSPIHAASLMSGIANRGVLPRPVLVDRVVAGNGDVLYRAESESLGQVVRPATAQKLLQMMEYTTTIGTSKSEFMRRNRPILGNVKVAAKTGTLSGDNPKGMTNWFIAAAPKDNPEIAVAVIVVNPRGISSRASHIGRQVFEAYFR